MPDHPIMSWINVGEVYNVTHRLAGANEADDIVRRMRAVVDLDLPSADRIMAAARMKAQHPLAYADAFAVATTLAYDAVLYTGDPEILEAASRVAGAGLAQQRLTAASVNTGATPGSHSCLPTSCRSTSPPTSSTRIRSSVQDDQARKLCCRREQQVRYRGRAVQASVSEQ